MVEYQYLSAKEKAKYRKGLSRMVKQLKIYVLVDNTAKPSFLCEWGLSILIDADESRILLDTGSSNMFAKNAKQLGIDLASVRFGILSHAHYDHSDGMDAFFSLNDSAPFLIREGSDENCFGLKEGSLEYIGIQKGLLSRFHDRIRYVSGVYEITDGIWLVPHRQADCSAIARRNDLYVRNQKAYFPDRFFHEQSLVIDTSRGLIVFSSCSHTGIMSILEDIRQALGRSDICAYVGGLHLYKLTDPELSDLCDKIEDSAIARIFTGHCTGDHAYRFLQDRLGTRIVQFYSGYVHEFFSEV